MVIPFADDSNGGERCRRALYSARIDLFVLFRIVRSPYPFHNENKPTPGKKYPAYHQRFRSTSQMGESTCSTSAGNVASQSQAAGAPRRPVCRSMACRRMAS